MLARALMATPIKFKSFLFSIAIQFLSLLCLSREYSFQSKTGNEVEF
jgi:hypothetical protein